MKNPFKEIQKIEGQERNIARCWQRIELLEKESDNLHQRVKTLEDLLSEGSAHPWAKLIGAILQYLNVDVQREWVPDEWYRPPQPPVHEVVKLVPRSKPSKK